MCIRDSYRVALYAVQNHKEALSVIRRLVEQHQADGIILSGTRPDDARVGFLQDHDFPFVTYGTTAAHGAHPFVDADNAGLMRVAVLLLSLTLAVVPVLVQVRTMVPVQPVPVAMQ